ncbi:uncharacterized protein LOC123382933 isoform X1 [Felis catus]|uniref:uncharacterized protein LOC123382933 isoform X1 n=1 Tax=Felis catus TaxID=9685 RepID=UPI001D199670|nr:uncharacterized protein LOC123382933 isoform X1 [Felis catus]
MYYTAQGGAREDMSPCGLTPSQSKGHLDGPRGQQLRCPLQRTAAAPSLPRKPRLGRSGRIQATEPTQSSPGTSLHLFPPDTVPLSQCTLGSTSCGLVTALSELLHLARSPVPVTIFLRSRRENLKPLSTQCFNCYHGVGLSPDDLYSLGSSPHLSSGPDFPTGDPFVHLALSLQPVLQL